MGQESPPTPRVILIAPNVSYRMGGEAIKSLQIYQNLVDAGVDVHQITHSRVRDELNENYPEMKVSYIEESKLDGFLWATKIFRYVVNPLFMYRAARLARELIAQTPGAVIHYTSPISPVTPLFATPGIRVVVGPLNGNIHHPRGFRNRESLVETLRRVGMVPMQWFHWAFFVGKQRADVLLVAGGARTYESLRIAGCRDEQFRDSLDSGVPSTLTETPPIEHSGSLMKFVHHGRLVAYKGTDLAIKALARTRNPITLDIIGDGPERPGLENLAVQLGVQDRVHFAGWVKHDLLIDRLRGYRAMVSPSLAEANGIVFQEAMMLGLPVVCLNWGGPSLLVTPETGFLIEPGTEDQVVPDLADRMDRLAEDGELANRMALKSRAEAIERGFSWSQLIGSWITIYRELALKNDKLTTKPAPSVPVSSNLKG